MNGENAENHQRLMALSKPLANGKAPPDVFLGTKPGGGKFLRKGAHHVERRVMRAQLAASGEESEEFYATATTGSARNAGLTKNDWMYEAARRCSSVTVTADRVFFNK